MKKGCGKTFLKEEGMMDEGKWYCNEECAPSEEELLIEEQRLLKRLAQEMGHEDLKGEKEEETTPEEEEENKSEEENGAEKGEELEAGFDLTVSVSNKKEVLSLAELEEKYKNLNQVDEKVQEGEDELEDSLN